MDKETQKEIVQKELSAIKEKDPKAYTEYKNRVKGYLTEHPEITSLEDKDLSKEIQLMLMYSVAKIGPEKTDAIVSKHFAPAVPGKFAKIAIGTSKDPTAMLRFLVSKLSAQVERAMLAHKVYVLSRGSIRNGVEFPNDEPDPETGEKPKHDTLSITLWDNDAKQIIPMFLVDDQIEPHKSLEANKAYSMQIGNYNAEKDRWYASKDPSVIPLNGDSFVPDLPALAEYVKNTYPKIKEPYDDVIAESKKNPRKRYAIHAYYAKKPSYIEITPNESTVCTISLPYSPITQGLDDEGELIVVGNFQKSKPREGQPKTSDYVIFPELVINISESGDVKVHTTDSGNKDDGKEEETAKAKKDEIDDVL